MSTSPGTRPRTNGRSNQPQAQRGYLEAANQQVNDTISEQPIASVSAAFGVGLIAGVGLVALYCAYSKPTMSSRAHSLAEQISDAVRNAIPQSLSSYYK